MNAPLAAVRLRGPRAMVAMLAIALSVNLLLFAVVYRLVMPRDVESIARRVTQFVEFVHLMPSTREFDASRNPSLPPPPVTPQRPPQPDMRSSAAAAQSGPGQPMSSASPSLPALAVPAAGDMSLLERALGEGPPAAGGGQGLARGVGSGSGSGDAASATLMLRADEIEINLVPSYRLAPDYPMRALKEGIEGVVTVEFDIDTDGNVQAPRILHAEPPALFDDAVMRALPKWKFSPKLVNGRPVARRARQDVVFRLRRQ